MTVRFFMLQAHYRSTLDFSNEALQAAEKGFVRLMNTMKLIDGLKTSEQTTSNVKLLTSNIYDAMNSDFNSPIVLAHLFEGVRMINAVHIGTEKISIEDKNSLSKLMNDFVFDILGLKEENAVNTDKIDGLMQMIFHIRNNAKTNKDFKTSDEIRDELKRLGFEIKDGKEGTSYTITN